MCKKEKTVERHFYNNTFIKYFTIAFLVIMAFLFVCQWISLHKDFDSFKKETLDQVSKLENSKTNLIKLEEVEQDSLNYIFKASDIDKINNNLNALASEIYQERNKAEAIIDKDIDRLNLYMAIGIGFLALLGVFVPIFINVLTNNDLEKKLEELDSKYKLISTSTSDLEKQVKDLDSEELKGAISNANEALEKSKEIDGLKTKTNSILPKISIISLQIAIHRLFNVSSLSLSKSREESKELFVNLFESIKDHLKQCRNDEKLKITNSEIMKQTLIDFANLINDESFKFTNYLTNRNIDERILVENLKILSNSNENNQDNNYNLVIQSFETFIEQIQNIDA